MRRPRGRRGEAGSATVLALSMAVLLGLAGALSVVAAAVLADRHRAEAAADLGAVAAASALRWGAEPCAAAAAVVTANGSRLTGCRVVRGTVRVRVTTLPRQLLGQAVSVPATASAG